MNKEDDFFELSSTGWLVREKSINSKILGRNESLFTLGNGYIGSRGCFEEYYPGERRGTYISGLYEKNEATVPEIVNIPDWTNLIIYIDGEEVKLKRCKIFYHRRTLDMKKAILTRLTRLLTPSGKALQIETARFVSAEDQHLGVMYVRLTPENFSGVIRIVSGINNSMSNKGKYENEKTKHYYMEKVHTKDKILCTVAVTREKKVKIYIAQTLDFHNHRKQKPQVRNYGEFVAQEYEFFAEQDTEYNFQKTCSIYSSLHSTSGTFEEDVCAHHQRVNKKSIHEMYKRHIRRWEKWWDKTDITIVGDPASQLVIRFNVYHLTISAPWHVDYSSVAAKGLTGEGYKGHVFWDSEIFNLPFYIYNLPTIARNMLMYRYNTLEGALRNAEKLGYKGAKYAWESADTGDETTPAQGNLHDGTPVRIWCGEIEVHVNVDIVYAIIHYCRVNSDYNFLYNYGAEVIFMISRFWASRVEKNDRGQYEIKDVIGPDEMHTHVNNSTFTNFMVKWGLNKAVIIWNEMKRAKRKVLNDLMKKYKLTESEIKQWQEISDTIRVLYDEETKLFEEFDGYFGLEDFEITRWNTKGVPIVPRDYDLSDEHIEKTQLIKQADILVLLFLLNTHFSPEVKRANYDYYEKRALHVSTLSPCLHAIMGLEVGDDSKAYSYFMRTSMVDLEDIQGNTEHGVHLASTGGAWMSIIYGFVGMRLEEKSLSFNPTMPYEWQEISFTIYWKKQYVEITVKKNHMTFFFKSARKNSKLEFIVQNKSYIIPANSVFEVPIKSKFYADAFKQGRKLKFLRKVDKSYY
ncbi:glycoside hydrolase family 65 protein [Candidatus Margulisiibacteriota bacterium]